MSTLHELVAAERAAQGLPTTPSDEALCKFVAAFDAVMNAETRQGVAA